MLVVSVSTSSVAIVALQCRLTGSLAPISVSARCHATGKRTPGVRMEEHESKRVHAARWQQYAAGAFVPPAPLGRTRDGPSPEEGVLPPALRAWVERSFAQCTEAEEHLIVEREFLQRVAQGGLDEVDWDAEPLIDWRAASPSSAEPPPSRLPPPAAVATHTGAWREQAEAGQGMLTDERLAARPQPRMSHREQMARLAEAAHAAEVEALAARVPPSSIYAQQQELQAKVARAPYPHPHPHPYPYPMPTPTRTAYPYRYPEPRWRAHPNPTPNLLTPTLTLAQVARAPLRLRPRGAGAQVRGAQVPPRELAEVEPPRSGQGEITRGRRARAIIAEVARGADTLAQSRAAERAARLQPRVSHTEQMARLAEAAHAAEVRALAARGLAAGAGPRGASGLRAPPPTAHGGLPGGRRGAPAAAPASVTSSGHRIRVRDRREVTAA